jgi:hypothetical protein
MACPSLSGLDEWSCAVIQRPKRMSAAVSAVIAVIARSLYRSGRDAVL